MFKNWFRKRTMNIAIKLAVVVAALLIPIVLLGFEYYTAAQVDIRFAEKETLGLRYLPSVKSLLANVIDINRLRALQSDVDTGLAALDRVDLELGPKLNEKSSGNSTTDQVNRLKEDWRELKLLLAGGGEISPQALAKHDEVMAELLELIRTVGDRSNLEFDSEIETYYLAYSVLKHIPEVLSTLSFQMELLSGKLDDEQRGLLVAAAEDTANELKGLRRDMEVAFGATPALRTTLAGDLNAAAALADQFDSVTRRLAAGEPLQVSVLSDQGRQAVASFLSFYDKVAAQTEIYVRARLNRLQVRRNLQLGVSLLLIVAALGLVYWINRGIIAQTDSLSSVFGQIGIGDFDARAKVLSTDELGRTAEYLNGMLDSIRGLLQSQEERDQIQIAIQRLLEQVSTVAEGDLTTEAEVTADMTGAIADSFNYMIGELRALILGVTNTTLQVSTAAGQVLSTTNELAKGSESQLQQITDTTAAVDEMATSIHQVSENAASAAAVAEQALASAKEGADRVNQTINGMSSIRSQVQETAKRIKRLGESSQEIGEIVELIGDVADRTSILALNASIQAAAAGEAGRGFAVVATEVDRLAERAAEATKNIAALIRTIQSETNEAVSAMEETTRQVVQGSNMALDAGKSLDQIGNVANRLADLIQTISLAARQQARGSESIAISMSNISDVTNQSTSGTRQAAVAIQGLAALADELRNSVSRFRLPGKQRALGVR